jgi:dihydroorotase (multifunctional complex type)
MIESEAVSRAINIAAGAGNRLHIYHLSSIQALELVKNAKVKSQPVTAEVLVNHLLLAVDEHGHLGTLIKMNPPIRSSEHRTALWEALHKGWIDNLASDHAPHAPDEKLDKREVWDVGSGYPGLETNIPLMLTQVHAGKLTLPQLVHWYSEKPARMWSIYPRKGSLSVGSDADFVLIDMHREATIDATKFYSQAKFSPFNGWKLKGGIDRTFLRGQLICEKGRIVGAPRGQMIRPDRKK